MSDKIVIDKEILKRCFYRGVGPIIAAFGAGLTFSFCLHLMSQGIKNLHFFLVQALIFCFCLAAMCMGIGYALEPAFKKKEQTDK